MRLFDTELREISRRDRAHWSALAYHDGALVSPYLLPEFADLVNAQRGDVRVLIAEEHARPVGYFAYHAPNRGVARPVGAPLSDYEGFAAAPGFTLPHDDLLEEIGAGSLIYNNWHGAAPGKTRSETTSSIVDLSEGADAWIARKRSTHRKHFKKLDQRRRKAEREFGPMRVVFGDPDGARLQSLLTWKSSQYRQSGLLDLCDVAWVKSVIETCAERRFGPLRGLVASLYLGDELVAVEMGLMAGGVYHSWFPAYDQRFASVSPGLLLLQGIIEHADRLKLTRIDLGGGEYDYKAPYTDHSTPLLSGRALTTGLSGGAVKAWEGVEQACRALPAPFKRAPLKLRRRWAQTTAAEPRLTGQARRMASAFANAPKRLTA